MTFKKLFNVICTILGFYLLFYIIANRLRRLIDDFDPLIISNQFDPIIMCIGIGLIILHALTIYKLFINTEPNKFTRTITVIIANIHIMPYITLFKFIVKSASIRLFIENCAISAVQLQDHIESIAFLFMKLPRFIVALSFFFDVCILHQFYYFWKLIPLLLVTLIFQCIRYIIQQWAQEVDKECRKSIIVTVVARPKQMMGGFTRNNLVGCPEKKNQTKIYKFILIIITQQKN